MANRFSGASGVVPSRGVRNSRHSTSQLLVQSPVTPPVAPAGITNQLTTTPVTPPVTANQLAGLNVTPVVMDLETSLEQYIAESPSEELADRQKVAKYFRDDLKTLTPCADVSLIGCSTITTLPIGFNPEYNVKVFLNDCKMLKELPKEFSVRFVGLSGCNDLLLTKLSSGFEESIIELADDGGRTTIPESLFKLSSKTHVKLQGTFLNPETLEMIKKQTSAKNYNGPRFFLDPSQI